MSKWRMSKSYIASALLHGVVGYFIINAAVRVALPEGEVLEMAVDQAPPPKGDTLERPKPAPLPLKPMADTSEVEEAPKKSKPAPKPLPVIKEKISDISRDDVPEEKSEIKDSQGDLETKVDKDEKAEPKETPQEETPPVPVPIVAKEESTQSAQPPPVAEQQQAVTEEAVPPQPQQPPGQAQPQDPAQYGVPSGTQIKDASLLSSRPGNRPPQYPHFSRLKRQQGDVQLLGYVNSQGQVEKLFVEKSSGYPALDKAAFESFKKWSFYPGQADWVRKTIRFVLKDQ